MLMVNIAEAKAKLSEYLEAVSRGDRVVICNRNKPIAELRAVEQAPAQPRDLSPMYAGQTFITDAFFEPMTDAELFEWNDGPIFPASPHPAKVAETRASYETGATGTRKKNRRK